MPRSATRRPSAPGFTLVLGGGGVPGLAYLSGALQALHECGLDPRSANLVVGTSAGALVGALVRTGCPLEELAERSIGRHLLRSDPKVLRPSWDSARDLPARVVGTSWVLGRLLTRVPFPAPPARLARALPAGLAVARNDDNVKSLPQQWPDKQFWAVAVDVDSGRRVALGSRAGDRQTSLGRAVQASMAVPGVLSPVRLGGRVLVDGGVHSTTNLDLAADSAARLVIGVAPMTFDPLSPPGRSRAIARSRFQRVLEREARQLRDRGFDVLLLRPGAEQLQDYSAHFLRTRGTEAVRLAGAAKSREQLQAPEAQRLLARAVR